MSEYNPFLIPPQTFDTNQPHMKQRRANTQLRVSVKSHKGNVLTKANVALVKRRSEEVIDLKYDPKSKRYFSPKLDKGGDYILRVSSRGYLTERRPIRIFDGLNEEAFVLGTKGMPYYHRGRVKVPFIPLDKIAVKIQVDRNSDAYGAFQATCDKLNFSQSHNKLRCLKDGNVLVLKVPEDLKEEEIEKALLLFEEHPAIRNAGRVLRETNDAVTFLSHTLIVRFHPVVTDEKALAIMEKFSIKPARKIPYVPNAWIALSELVPSLRFLDLVNDLNRLDEVIYAEPSLNLSLADLAISPVDYLTPEQWHLPVANLPDAWQVLRNANSISVSPGDPDDITFGSRDIVISIFDQGIQSTTHPITSVVSAAHPDFLGTLTDGTQKVSEFYDFLHMEPNNDMISLSHGMGSAGVATALIDDFTLSSSLGEGVVGAAPNCKLMSVVRPDGKDELYYTDAFVWMAGFEPGWRDDVGTYSLGTIFPAAPTQPADIISCGFTWDPEPISGLVSDTLDYITTYGRGGRGVAIFWASGNYDFLHPITGEPIDIVTAATLHPKVMAVGASTKDTDGTTEIRATYSAIAVDTINRDLDFVAPSSTEFDPANHDPYKTIGSTPDAQFGIISADFTEEGNLPGNPANSTTLVGVSTSSGLSTLTVASTSGFAVAPVPHMIFIGNPGGFQTEVREIKGIPSSTTITVEALDHSHPTGTTIIAGGVPAYQNTFGGTSAAAPLAAGIAALCLSINPTLSWTELRHILRITAEKIDHSNSSSSGAWTGPSGDAFLDYSRWYGWGRLDAHAAVVAAYNYNHEIDLVIRENLADIGLIPSSGWHAESPDIWVRQTNDAIPTTLAYSDPPPHENPKRGQDNYLYIRVKNFGTQDSHEFWIRGLIAHFPGFEFRYPQEWRPSNLPGQPIPAFGTGSYLIGESHVSGLAAGDDLIVKMTWDELLIPPETVVEGGMTVHWHPCLLAEITPHDGPLPSGTTFAVKDYNNLAHRNIAIDPADPSSTTLAVAVMAGTAHSEGLQSIILDRSLLPADYRVFVRSSDKKVMNQWNIALEKSQVKETRSLDTHTVHDYTDPKDPSSIDLSRESEEDCEVILLDDTRIQIKCGDQKSLLIHAPAKTRLTTIFHQPLRRKPLLTKGKVEGQEVIFFDGGVASIEIPTNLEVGEYLPLIFGLSRPVHRKGNGTLLINQKLANGELSTGYAIQG